MRISDVLKRERWLVVTCGVRVWEQVPVEYCTSPLAKKIQYVKDEVLDHRNSTDGYSMSFWQGHKCETVSARSIDRNIWATPLRL